MRCKCGGLLEYETHDPRDELCNSCYAEVKRIIEEINNNDDINDV